jgi:hypothetical protein
MPSAACFGDILAEKLKAHSAAWAARPMMDAAWRPAAPAAGFSPLGWGAFSANDMARGAACFAYAAGQPRTAKPKPAPPARPLTAAQRAALECLRAFGAPLAGAAVTDSEVKAAFRELARRFHPDRHPEADDAERQYLGRAFGQIAEAYRVLGRD